MSEEWSDWIWHDGNSCPVPNGVLVNAIHHDGLESIADQRGNMSSWFKNCPLHKSKIIRYRIRKPRGLTMLQEIAAGVREPVDA